VVDPAWQSHRGRFSLPRSSVGSVNRSVHDLITYMIDGYQLEVFFFNRLGVLCRFQRVSGTNEEIKRSWRPSLLWSRNRSSTIFDHSIILQPCRSCFYDPVGPRPMRWVSPRSSVHDHALGLSTIVRLGVCPRSLLQSSQTATL